MLWDWKWLADAFQDVRFAGRLLSRDRGFAAGAVIPLAFAMACTACALTLVDSILFRPLGMKDPDRVAAVYSFSQQRNAYVSSSYPEFRDVQSLGNVVESAAAFVRIPVNVRLAEGTERKNSEIVTADYFRTVGVAPVLGRPLKPEDHREGAPPVALVSYSLWQSLHQGSSSVLGSRAWIDGVAFTIVGVMPRGYGGSLMDWYSNPSFWIPLAQIRSMLPPFRNLDFENLRDMEWLMTVVRLRRGVGLAQLQAAADTLTKRAEQRRDVRIVALPANQARFFPGRRAATVRILWILVGVSASALAVACFNLASLLLARAAARQKEIGTRLALGAGMPRLLQQFVIENAVLAGCACGLGLPVAVGMTKAASTFESAFGLSLNLGPDSHALAISAAAGLATAMLAGLALAWNLSRIHPASAMKDELPVRRLARMSARDLFVVGQIACAMVAVVAAALLGSSMRKWAAVPLGYDARGILLGTVDALSARIPPGERERIYKGLLAEVRSGTRGAALAGEAMPTRLRMTLDVSPDASPDRWTAVNYSEVSDGYFELLRIPLISGRSVLPGDDSHSQPAVVVNKAAATLFWPGRNPIGRGLRVKGEAAYREVVGVVADVRFRPLGETESAQPIAYLPIYQHLPLTATIHARTPGEPKLFVAPLRRVVARFVRDMPLSDVQTLDEKVQSGLSQVRLVSVAVWAMTAVGVALALAGIVAAGAYRVAQRKREIAVRIAIGAETGHVMRSFAARGVGMGLAGAAVGLLPSAWVSSALRTSLRGIEAPGPLLFVIAAVTLVSIVGGASWAVARRIARLQPSDILRAQ